MLTHASENWKINLPDIMKIASTEMKPLHQAAEYCPRLKTKDGHTFRIKNINFN
jgi:hypothetical protein